MSFGFKSNSAIRPLLRYFLGLSLPFADCPNTDCTNHGYNVFEHYGSSRGVTERRRKKLGLYRKQGDHRVACRECKTKIYTGNALHLKSYKWIGEILEGLREQRSIANTIETTRISASSYYSHLHRIGARLRDWQAFQNAQLLKKRFENWDGPIRAYSDTIRVSIRRAGEGRRSQYLNIHTTVIALGRSYFVLAAHPGFLPESHCPDFGTLLDGWSVPKYLNEWDCLDYGFGTLPPATVRETISTLSDVGRNGYFSASVYSELAHFLVVDKLLSRFPKIHLYLDGSVPLYSAALTAFASEIQTGRIEIALFQHRKDHIPKRRHRVRSQRPRSKDKEAILDRAWHNMKKELASRTEPEASNLSELPVQSREYANVFKRAFRGGFSKNGSWAWLPFPPSSEQYADPRTLWLTWNPTKEYRTVGRELLLSSTLQPVDSAFSSFRRRGRGMQRASFRAVQGLSYVEAYADPMNVTSELWISMLRFNYLTEKRSDREPRARGLNLMRSGGHPPNPERLALKFRLGIDQAEKMSGWVSQ